MDQKQYFDKIIDMHISSEFYNELFELCKNDEYSQVREQFFTKLENFQVIKSGSDDNFLNDYIVLRDRINFTIGFKMGCMFFCELKRGVFCE